MKVLLRCRVSILKALLTEWKTQKNCWLYTLSCLYGRILGWIFNVMTGKDMLKNTCKHLWTTLFSKKKKDVSGSKTLKQLLSVNTIEITAFCNKASLLNFAERRVKLAYLEIVETLIAALDLNIIFFVFILLFRPFLSTRHILSKRKYSFLYPRGRKIMKKKRDPPPKKKQVFTDWHMFPFFKFIWGPFFLKLEISRFRNNFVQNLWK